MIDTVVLTMKPPSYRILDGSRFTPSIDEVEKQNFGGRSFRKCVFNPSVDRLKPGFYLPRMTYLIRAGKHGLERELKIEFSAPKLIYPDNIDEVAENDLEKLVIDLHRKLNLLGIHVEPNNLIHAPVSNIHFCKNIPFTNYQSVNFIISTIYKVNATQKIDLNIRHFKNQGQALYFYAKNANFVLYDKIRDLNAPKGRSVDENGTIQKSLFKYFETKKEPLELLRLEARLTQKQKLVSILQKVGLSIPNPRLSDLFRKEVARKVLLFYWNYYVSIPRHQFLFSASKTPEELTRIMFSYFRGKRQKVQYKKVFSLLGFYLYAKQHGIKSVRDVIDTNFSSRTWPRAVKDFDIISEFATQKRDDDFISYIENELEKFEPYRLNFPLDFVN